MKKIKLDSKKLQILKDKVVDLSNEDLKSINGGISNWMCDTVVECTIGACSTFGCTPTTGGDTLISCGPTTLRTN